MNWKPGMYDAFLDAEYARIYDREELWDDDVAAGFYQDYCETTDDDPVMTYDQYVDRYVDVILDRCEEIARDAETERRIDAAIDRAEYERGGGW